MFASVSVAALALPRSEGFAFFAVEAAIHVLITAAKIRFFFAGSRFFSVFSRNFSVFSLHNPKKPYICSVLK